jgi:hypothetical protein
MRPRKRLLDAIIRNERAAREMLTPKRCGVADAERGAMIVDFDATPVCVTSGFVVG